MKHLSTALVTVKPGRRVNLRDIEADATGVYNSKDETLARRDEVRLKIDELQEKLYAEGKQSLLIVLQAMDTGGKDGALKNLLKGLNPTGIHVTSFKKPTESELAHDSYGASTPRRPARGMIGVWNRSHYEDVLIGRVRSLVPEKIWRARYEQINQFEALLAANGTRIVKFYLHISKDEQKRRLEARLNNPEKTWKFNPADLEERKVWDEYQDAYEDVLAKCSTPVAPWDIVPANNKWARDIALAERVAEVLEEMNPQFPIPDFDPKSFHID
jgi:PPK2 family polyphosphate:nucleotide phosphotransferase